DRASGRWRSPEKIVQLRWCLVEVPLQEQRPRRQQYREHKPQQEQHQDQRQHETPRKLRLSISIGDFIAPVSELRRAEQLKSKIQNRKSKIRTPGALAIPGVVVIIPPPRSMVRPRILSTR